MMLSRPAVTGIPSIGDATVITNISIGEYGVRKYFVGKNVPKKGGRQGH
jgi:hypothetical protein